jgi:hypothetical protein
MSDFDLYILKKYLCIPLLALCVPILGGTLVFVQIPIHKYTLSVCVCVCVCVSQFVAERSAILLVLVIKLTKETRLRV